MGGERELTTLVGADVKLEGLLRASSPARIDGTFKGEVRSDSVLVVGPDGRVDGTVTADELIVMGRASGEFRVARTVEVREGGSLKGTVVCRALVIQDGAEARCEVRTPPEEPHEG